MYSNRNAGICPGDWRSSCNPWCNRVQLAAGRSAPTGDGPSTVRHLPAPAPQPSKFRKTHQSDRSAAILEQSIG